MPSSHAPFAIMNATLNRIVRPLLRSRWHRLVSDKLLLITVTGKKTGRDHTFPVGYRERDGTITIGVAMPAGKRWWRNLREEAPVKLHLRGDDRTGRAIARGDEQTGVTVEVRLDPASQP